MVAFAGSSDEDAERERELIEAVLDRRVDGLIIVPTGDDYSYLLRDVAAGIGLVFVDRPPLAIDADCVLSEDRERRRARGLAPDRARPPPDRLHRLSRRCATPRASASPATGPR